MVGCAAFGCSNQSSKGFLMKAFPKDPKRRKIWADKVRRKNWIPTDHSRICEVMFCVNITILSRHMKNKFLGTFCT